MSSSRGIEADGLGRRSIPAPGFVGPEGGQAFRAPTSAGRTPARPGDFAAALRQLEDDMFEDAIFAAYNKANQTIHEATKAKLALTQKHYDGELEVHTGSSIFGVRLVSFGIGDRGSLTLKNIGRDWRNLNHQHITKRKLINLVVSRAYAVTYEFLRSTDMVCPSMIAMTWKRPNRKDAAWVVLLKNAVIVQRYGDIGDFARYVAIGEELIELVPKSMPHIPEETAGLVPGALNLLRR